MSQSSQFKNLVDLCNRSVERFADRRRFGTRVDGRWEWITFGAFGHEIDRFRGALEALGVGPGDSVAAISNNRVEWAVGAYATYGRGAVYVPMYEKQLPEDWEYIIADSGAKVALVANRSIATVLTASSDRIPSLEHIVVFDADPSEPDSYGAALLTGDANPTVAEDPDPSQLAGLIYTSGTTGRPKGVRLTHGNFTSNVNAVQTLFPLRDDDCSLSFLPWAHSFGQTCELHSLLSMGAASAINSHVDNLIEELAEVGPTLFYSVPRVFNKIYDGLNKKMAAASPIQQAIFHAAMDNAERRRVLADAGGIDLLAELKHWFFDRVVFTKVRERLGGHLRHAFSGGAAISPEVATFIDNIGITVFEGYGLSETSPIATMNSPASRRIGSVGKPIPGVEIIIDRSAVASTMGDQGEILIKGPNVMEGYHRLEEQTREVIREDGAFRSGDLGRVDSDGFLYITGRIKEQYKLENGKYVVPVPLEEQITLSGYISQAMVYGDNRPYNVAVLVPDFSAVDAWGKVDGMPEDLCQNDEVRDLIAGELEKQHENVFKGFERIKEFRLVAEEFSVENDLLTPKLSLKRRNAISKYESFLEDMYAGG